MAQNVRLRHVPFELECRHGFYLILKTNLGQERSHSIYLYYRMWQCKNDSNAENVSKTHPQPAKLVNFILTLV